MFRLLLGLLSFFLLPSSFSSSLPFLKRDIVRVRVALPPPSPLHIQLVLDHSPPLPLLVTTNPVPQFVDELTPDTSNSDLLPYWIETSGEFQSSNASVPNSNLFIFWVDFSSLWPTFDMMDHANFNSLCPLDVCSDPNEVVEVTIDVFVFSELRASVLSHSYNSSASLAISLFDMAEFPRFPSRGPGFLWMSTIGLNPSSSLPSLMSSGDTCFGDTYLQSDSSLIDPSWRGKYRGRFLYPVIEESHVETSGLDPLEYGDSIHGAHHVGVFDDKDLVAESSTSIEFEYRSIMATNPVGVKAMAFEHSHTFGAGVAVGNVAGDLNEDSVVPRFREIEICGSDRIPSQNSLYQNSENSNLDIPIFLLGFSSLDPLPFTPELPTSLTSSDTDYSNYLRVTSRTGSVGLPSSSIGGLGGSATHSHSIICPMHPAPCQSSEPVPDGFEEFNPDTGVEAAAAQRSHFHEMVWNGQGGEVEPVRNEPRSVLMTYRGVGVRNLVHLFGICSKSESESEFVDMLCDSKSMDEVLFFASELPPFGWEIESSFGFFDEVNSNSKLLLRFGTPTDFGNVVGDKEDVGHYHQISFVPVETNAHQTVRQATGPGNFGISFVEHNHGDYSKPVLFNSSLSSTNGSIIPSHGILIIRPMKSGRWWTKELREERGFELDVLQTDVSLDSMECFGIDWDHPSVCSAAGLCYAPDQCICPIGFAGDCSSILRCQIDVDSECSNHGTCQLSSDQYGTVCECNDGYYGYSCEFEWCGVNPQADPSLPPDEKYRSSMCAGIGMCFSLGENGSCSCPEGENGEVYNDFCVDSQGEPDVIEVPQQSVYWIAIVVAVVGLLFLLICGVILGLVVWKLRSKKWTPSRSELHNDDLSVSLLDQDDFGITVAQPTESSMKMAQLEIDPSLFIIEYSELTVQRRIGAGGGGGAVYMALWGAAKTPVAFKCFRIEDFLEDERFKSFESEARVMASVAHPHILRFFGATVSPPRIGIVMEFCSNVRLFPTLPVFSPVFEKGDLEKYLNKNPEVSLRVRLVWLQEVCSAMTFLHGKSILHRDLKPQNVLLDDQLSTKLMDFGLARVTKGISDDLTGHVGTSYFMAPEVCSSGQYSTAVDVFSWGILAFQLITLRWKPYGQVSFSVEFRVASDPSFRPQFQENESDSICQELIDLMQECWSHQPDDRPSFAEAQSRLESVLVEKEEGGSLLIGVEASPDDLDQTESQSLLSDRSRAVDLETES